MNSAWLSKEQVERMKVKRLRIHYYAEENEKRKIGSVILAIARKKEYESLQWYMKRDWRYGPHIGIYVIPQKGNSKLENNFFKEIWKGIESYWKKYPNIKMVMPNENVLMQLAQLERKEGDSPEEYLPIQPHCSCVKETIFLKPEGYYNTRTEYLFYQKKRIACRYLLLDTLENLKEMDKETQYLFLTALFREVAECYPKEGLLRGCLSFKSHVIGFLENSDSRTDLLHKGFQQIYECMRDELKMMEEKQYIFSVGQELLEQWGRFFRTFVEEIYFNGKIQSRLKKESNYVEESVKNLSGYTKFHHNWISRSQFADFFFSEEFYRYRTLVNFFYLLLPSLGFGPREKHLGCYLITRTIEDTKKQEVSKMNVKGTKKKNQVVTVNVFEQQEIIAKAEIIKSNLKASTWRELETKGKFDKNAKLSFVNDDMLILGCDVGSDTHYARAIDTRGRELSKSAFPFSNTLEGFQSLIEEIWQCDRNRIYEANLIVGMFMSDIGKVIGTMEEAIVEDISITISRAFYIDRHTMEGRSVDMERHLDCPICGPGKKGYLCIKNCR